MTRPAPVAGPPFRAALLAPRCWPSWLGVGLFSLLLLVPRRVRDGLAARVGDLQYRANAKRRGIVEINLAQCYPDLSEAERRAMARAHFRAYARVMADLACLWWDWRRRVPLRRCDVHGIETLHALRAAGDRVILLNAHTIAIEFGGVALSAHVPLTAIVKPLNDPVLDWLLARARGRYGCTRYSRAQGMRPVVRELRAGRCLYYSPDEDLGPRVSVFAPFFGHPKATVSTLGRLAQMLQAKVVPVYAWYDAASGRYQVHVQAPLERFPSGEPATDAARMNAALERSIALCPTQYLWNYRLFRSRPDGTRLRYPAHARWKRRRRRRQKARNQARDQARNQARD